MSQKREVVAEIDITSKNLDKVVAASTTDLHHLKLVHPASKIKYGDISPYIHQNCNATSHVLTQTVSTNWVLMYQVPKQHNYISKLRCGHTLHIESMVLVRPSL